MTSRLVNTLRPLAENEFWIIGESLNVMGSRIGPAFKNRDPQPIREEVLLQREKGVDMIDVNLGPAKKDGKDLLPWVVDVIQEVVDDIPLVLDTSNIEAIEVALPRCKMPPLINSIMARQERYDRMIPLAADHGADFIALMWGPEGLPRDENERAALLVELMTVAAEAGIDNDRMWVDGIVTPVNIQQPQAMSLMNFMDMLPEIMPGAGSTCGISNVSNGIPTHLRSVMNLTLAAMLYTHGMTSFIADARDPVMMDMARGKRPDIIDLIRKITAGNNPNMAELNAEHRNYAKSVHVILGKTLYSDSWLDI